MLIALTLLALSISPAAAAFKIGDWVLGQWQGGAYYYPGVVAQIQGNMITIQYDDGDVDTRPSNQVKPYDWRIGSRVECNWQSGGTYYPGHITQLGTVNLSIAYNDGDFEHTTVSHCRSR
jgi:hypothetical protein